MTVPLSQKCTPAGPSSCIRMCDSKARSVDRMCFSFAATQLLGLHPWDVPWTSPKLKTYFCLSLLSLSDKPPHFTPAQPPDGKSSVFSLCLPTLTIFVFFVFFFFFFWGGGVWGLSNNDLGSLPLKWAVYVLCQIWLLRFSFLHCWHDRHVARSAQSFDVRRLFWWLDLICSAQLVGLMFNTC